VFDFDDAFDESKYADVKLAGENRWNLTFHPVRVRYGSSYEIQIDPEQYNEPEVYLNRLPDGYYLDGIQWLTTLELNDNTPDLIKTWFTITKATAAPSTPPSTVRAPVSVPVPSCPMNCNGQGRCVAGNTCTCNNGFTTDPQLGCKAGETTKATVPGASTAPVIATKMISQVSLKTGTQKVEGTVTKDPKLFSGTYTGTKAATNGKPTVPGATTTGSGAAMTVSSVVALVAVALSL